MKRIQMLLILLITFTLAEIGIRTVKDAKAIPAFARRYKISCTTCHSVFPRLKAYGDEFAGNGFIMKEKEKERDYVTAGDDMLWLNKDFPVAARMEMFANYDEAKDVEKDLQSPWGIKLLSGGTLYKNIGYYFYFYMQERGEVAGIEDAYIHFDNIFDSNFDIMVGQFQTSDPLMKRELRLTYEDYQLYKTNIGYSNTNLAYDRGVMMVYGVEKTGTDIIGLIVNGNGKPEAVDRKMDQDNYKNVGFRVNQGLGDFSLGGYFYLGKEKEIGSDMENEISYWGPDFSIGSKSLEVTGQYLFRKDTNPYFINNAADIETNGYILEAVFAPEIGKSRHHFTVLYNRIDSDIDLHDYETGTLGATYSVARNLRILAEYTRDFERKKNRAVVGVIGAF